MWRKKRSVVGPLCVGGLLSLGSLGGVLIPATGAGAATRTTVAARPSAGCALSVPASPGMTTQLLAADGDNGGYVREVPPTYSGHRPMPVVIDLHGYQEGAPLQVTLTALGTYGDSHGFITITPQVADPVPLWGTTIGSKDPDFIGSLITTVSSTLCVDRNRIFVTGYSNGAFLTSTIACQYAGVVAAVAPVSGLTNPKGCHPSRAIPIVTFHGTSDQYVAYTGGLGPAGLKLADPFGGKAAISAALGSGAPGATGPSIPAITATWAARNGCAATPNDHRVASDVTLIAYRCPHNATVELYRITGGGHAWPGSLFSKGLAAAIGRTTYSISANQIMWKFFEAHPL